MTNSWQKDFKCFVQNEETLIEGQKVKKKKTSRRHAPHMSFSSHLWSTSFLKRQRISKKRMNSTEVSSRLNIFFYFYA